jgi:hypothetical protein
MCVTSRIAKNFFEVNADTSGHCVTGALLQGSRVREICSRSILLARGASVLAESSARLRDRRRRESGTLRGGLNVMNRSLSAER